MTARLSYTVTTAAQATGLSKSHIRDQIAAGRLRARRTSVTEDGEPTGNYIILAADLEAYLEGLVSA